MEYRHSDLIKNIKEWLDQVFIENGELLGFGSEIFILTIENSNWKNIYFFHVCRNFNQESLIFFYIIFFSFWC